MRRITAPRRFHFDAQAAIARAWDFIWEQRAKEKKEHPEWKDYRGQSTYVAASDLVNQVRQFAYETLQGKEWGSTGRAYYGGSYGVRLSGDLLGACRSWLLHNPKIENTNMGKGSVTGMRFRPRGTGPTEAEKKTTEERAKSRRGEAPPKPRHFSKTFGGRPFCTQAQRAKRGGYWSGRSKVWTTSKRADVTCPRCKKLLASMPAPVEFTPCDMGGEPCLEVHGDISLHEKLLKATPPINPTPWDNPDLFEKTFLREVIATGVSTSKCNLWDGNEKWVSKTIDPQKTIRANGMVACLYSGVAIRSYSADHVVYLQKEEEQ